MSTQSTSAFPRQVQNYSLYPVDSGSPQPHQTAVTKIFEDHIDPLYGSKIDVFKDLHENKEFKCRLFTVNEEPTGILVYDNHLRTRYEAEGFPSCMSVEFFYVKDSSSPIKTWGQHMLDAVTRSAKELKAKSISVKVSKTAGQMNALLQSNEFIKVRESGSRVWLYGKNIDVETTQKSGQKRGREDDVSFSSRAVAAKTSLASTVSSAPPSRLTSSTIGMKYLRMILDGRKTIEGRINSGMFARVAQGENIQFFCQQEKALCRVVRITKYPTFAQMLEREGVQSCLPDESNLQRAISIYANIPGYAAKEQQFGVVAIQLQLLQR